MQKQRAIPGLRDALKKKVTRKPAGFSDFPLSFRNNAHNASHALFQMYKISKTLKA